MCACYADLPCSEHSGALNYQRWFRRDRGVSHHELYAGWNGDFSTRVEGCRIFRLDPLKQLSGLQYADF